jgi:excisionase family DNA binding protein
MSTNQNPILLRKKELAALLHVSPRTIDSWIAQRVIPYVAPSARLHLFDADQVRKALEARFGVQPRGGAK